MTATKEKFTDLWQEFPKLIEGEDDVSDLQKLIRDEIDKTAYSNPVARAYKKAVRQAKTATEIFEFMIAEKLIGYQNLHLLKLIANQLKFDINTVERLTKSITECESECHAIFKDEHLSTLVEIYAETPYYRTPTAGTIIFKLINHDWSKSSMECLQDEIPIIDENELKLQMVRIQTLTLTFSIPHDTDTNTRKYFSDSEIKDLYQIGIQVEIQQNKVF